MTQLDLFGEIERAETEQQQWQQPATCPSCGMSEPNGFMLQNNHGYNPITGRISNFPFGEHPIFGERCVAQDLTRNHIISGVLRGDEEWLAESVARGKRYGLDTDAIIAEAEAGGPGDCDECGISRIWRVQETVCTTCRMRAGRK